MRQILFYSFVATKERCRADAPADAGRPIPLGLCPPFFLLFDSLLENFEDIPFEVVTRGKTLSVPSDGASHFEAEAEAQGPENAQNEAHE